MESSALHAHVLGIQNNVESCKKYSFQRFSWSANIFLFYGIILAHKHDLMQVESYPPRNTRHFLTYEYESPLRPSYVHAFSPIPSSFTIGRLTS